TRHHIRLVWSAPSAATNPTPCHPEPPCGEACPPQAGICFRFSSFTRHSSLTTASLITDHCVTPPWPFHSESLASASRAASPPHRLQFAPIGRPTRTAYPRAPIAGPQEPTADRRASTVRRPPAIAGPPAGFASPRSPTANRQAPIASRPVSSTASRPSPPFENPRSCPAPGPSLRAVGVQTRVVFRPAPAALRQGRIAVLRYL